MKTLLKIAAALVVLLLVVAAFGYGYLMYAFPKVPPAPTVTFDTSPERLARGEYLAEHVVGCTSCHTERDWTKFAGPIKRDRLGAGNHPFDLGPGGFLYSKNITPAGIGSWTDGELLRATTQGVSKDGSPLFPLMAYPHFGAMSEDDIHAVLAYVRSWKAIESVVPARKLSFPLNLIVRTMPGPNTFQPRPSPTDKLAYGKYLTRSALCSDCHTQIDDRGTPLPGMEFAGGMEFLDTGYRVRSVNITPDADTGIGAWTEQQFIDKFKGFDTTNHVTLSEIERRQNTVMPYAAFAGMTRDDLAAIYGYLRTLKPVTNRVNRFPDAK